jgi:branched-chain amino acid transport system ATP-binding protein
MNQATSDIAAPDLLRVNDIEVIYDGAILAVAGVSLTVPKGGIVALLGANGAGKSTTLKAISGLVRAERAQVSRGSIEFLGCDTAGVDPSLRVRQGMVHVLEGRHVFAQLTVEDNLRSGGFVRGLGRQDMARSGAHLHLVSPPENQAQDPGRADVRRRAADGRHRPGPDDASYFGTAR